MVNNLFIIFLASFSISAGIIYSQALHGHISGDLDIHAPQKNHHAPVPRIGGIAIYLGVCLGAFLDYQPKSWVETSPQIMILLIACVTPAFVMGLIEDLTKNIGAKYRLLAILISGVFAYSIMNVKIVQINISIVDYLLQFSIISCIFSVFAITGLTNAYNLIDGFNGLASMVSIIALSGLAIVSYQENDYQLLYISLAMLTSTLGFFVWNYPKGLLFLGDGGAYLLGFWVSILSILLVNRQQNISPWFALLINGYPILETLFSIYRRHVHQKKNPMSPDGIHLHSLIYRRCFKKRAVILKTFINRNSKTSIYLWIFSTITVIPSIIFRNNTNILIILFIIFCVLYIWIYKRLINFKTPRWLYID